MTLVNDDERSKTSSLSKPMAAGLFLLRLAVGWHLLYEGLAKLLIPNWTSYPYLILSRGPFSGIFHMLASSGGLVRAVDLLNIWGLTLLGLALMLGCFSRLASTLGIALLGFYYLAQPSWIQTDSRCCALCSSG